MSSMKNDMMCEYETYTIVNNLWVSLNQKFRKASSTKLHSLTLKFEGCKKHHDYSMKQQLRVISNMTHELKEAGANCSNEHKIQAIIRSLYSNWEHMKVNLTRNVNIQKFKDIVSNL